MTELRESTGPGTAAAKGRESPRRLALYLAGGALSIYFAVWVGPTAFYFEFQRPLLALEHGKDSSVIGLEPGPAAPSPEADGADGLEMRLPGGPALDPASEGAVTRVKLADGEIVLVRYPAGFLASLYQERLGSLGGAPEAGLGDASVLEDVARERLGRYDFCFSGPERRRYAARLLAKMVLWDLNPVKRFEMATGDGSCAALVEYSTGAVKVIVATGPGTHVILIPAEAPADWKASAASWLR